MRDHLKRFCSLTRMPVLMWAHSLENSFWNENYLQLFMYQEMFSGGMRGIEIVR